MKDVTWKQMASYLILLLLLLLRISWSALVLLHDDILAIANTSDPLRDWIVMLYGSMYFGGFILITIVVALNREDLQRLNLDKFYVILLIISGLLGMYVFAFNCITPIALLYLIEDAWLGKKMKLGKPQPGTLRIFLIIIGIFAGVFFLIVSFVNGQKIDQYFRYFIVEVIPFSILEEGIFRGLLIMFLKDLRLGEVKIIFIQTFLFLGSSYKLLVSTSLQFLDH